MPGREVTRHCWEDCREGASTRMQRC